MSIEDETASLRWSNFVRTEILDADPLEFDLEPVLLLLDIARAVLAGDYASVEVPRLFPGLRPLEGICACLADGRKAGMYPARSFFVDLALVDKLD